MGVFYCPVRRAQQRGAAMTGNNIVREVDEMLEIMRSEERNGAIAGLYVALRLTWFDLWDAGIGEFEWLEQICNFGFRDENRDEFEEWIAEWFVMLFADYQAPRLGQKWSKRKHGGRRSSIKT
jgi:hypothetical protein